MEIPNDLRYTKTHEWVKVVGAEVVVGITAHAQEELRDVVYVELPPPGKALKAAEPSAVVESVKAAFDIYAPVAGTVSRVNAALQNTPQLVNKDCYDTGWFFAITPANPNDVNALMTAGDYTKLIEAAAH